MAGASVVRDQAIKAIYLSGAHIFAQDARRRIRLRRVTSLRRKNSA